MTEITQLAEAIVMVAWIFIGVCIAVALLAVVWALGHRVIDSMLNRSAARIVHRNTSVVPIGSRKRRNDYPRPRGAA